MEVSWGGVAPSAGVLESFAPNEAYDFTHLLKKTKTDITRTEFHMEPILPGKVANVRHCVLETRKPVSLSKE